MAKIHTPIPKLKLNDGNSMPMLGYGTGTAWFKTGNENITDHSLIDAIKIAINMGYDHLDGAEVYKTEPELGAAIKASGAEREKLFVTTKALSSVTDLAAGLRTSLKKLQLDYVDLYLIHFPAFDHDAPNGWSAASIQKAWADMEKLKADGLARSIGVSNFLPEHLDALLQTAKFKPVVNQVEFHMYLQRRKLVEYCKTYNIALQAYAPLVPVTKATPGPVDEYLKSLAKKYAVNPAEICLRWCIDQDVVAITTSGKEQRLSDYLRVGTFQLTPREIEELNERGNERHFRAFMKDKFDPNDRT